MKAIDFILQTRVDLQEKSEHWKDKELFVKLQRAFVALQFDLPYFIHREILDIQEGKYEYYLTQKPLKNITFRIGNTKLSYCDTEYFYADDRLNSYTFLEDSVVIYDVSEVLPSQGMIAYKYEKELANEQCEIEIPTVHHEALRLLFLSKIHEKPTLNTKQRNLSLHYLQLYNNEVRKLRHEQKARPKNITSKFQRI